MDPDSLKNQIMDALEEVGTSEVLGIVAAALHELGAEDKIFRKDAKTLDSLADRF